MKTEVYPLWSREEYHYSMAFDFIPNLTCYLHEDEVIRPAILIAPGGGYMKVSAVEGEVVAKKFYEMGYNTFVCSYTVNFLNLAPLYHQPMQDLSRAIRYVRKNASSFHININQVILCGFSAGGHLCGSVGIYFEDFKDTSADYQDISNRPDAMILCYPVITFGQFTHKGTVKALLGDHPSEEDLLYYSLEKHVKEDTPPCFMWHTVTDSTVPVENNNLLAQAYKEKGITFAQHLFSHGPHGLSLANEDCANENYGTPYTLNQILNLINQVKIGRLKLDEEKMKDLNEIESKPLVTKGQVNEEVAVWPLLADQFIKRLYNL